MKHFYAEAWEDIYEYYQTVKDRLTQFHVSTNNGGGIYTNIANATIYPYSVLRYFTKLIYQALDKIEGYKDLNPERYSTLKARIMREYLSIIYLKITLSKAELTQEEIKEMKEIFKTYTGYFSIAKSSENGSDVDPDVLFG